MSSLRPDREPRISYGAISARYTGTTVEAPPTAKPKLIRPRINNPYPNTVWVPYSGPPGELITKRVPTKKSAERPMMVGRRPILSATWPKIMAPRAAAKISELMTMPIWILLNPISL